MDILESKSSFGEDIRWWIGIVAPRSAWDKSGTLINDKESGPKENKPEIDVYYNRVKVKVVGYHDQITDPNDLPWANILASPMMSAGYGFKDSTHYLEGGESVFGFWMDGEDEQKPCIVGVFYRHSKAYDQQQPLSGSAKNPTPRRGNLGGLTKVPTGETAGKNMGSNDPIPEERFLSDFKFDPITGRITSNVTVRPTMTNEGSSKSGMGDAADAHHTFLKRKTNRPTCKRDNSIAQITGLLGDFAEYLLTIQGYANFYVNQVTGAIANLAGEIQLIAKQIAGIMTGLFNAVRDALFSLIGDKIAEFVNSILPEEIKPIFGEGIKGVMDTIYCIFEKLIAALLKTILDFLNALVGKFVNAPLCAAEQFVGALLNNLFNQMQQSILPILNSISESIGGALGSVNDIIGKALEYIGIIHSFIGCDGFKCPLPSSFDNAYGPTQSERDSAKQIFGNISILNIPTSVDKDGNVTQNIGGFLNEAQLSLNTLFGEPTDERQRTAEYIASIVGGCETRALRCGPPVVEIFGGDGIGGVANAVVNNLGQIIGVDLIDRGFGYSKDVPPYVTFRDACGKGSGARGRVIINDDGTIGNVVIDYPGYNYPNTDGEVVTIYGTIPAGSTSDSTNSDSNTVTGQIDTVEVNNPGYGYNPDDTIDVNGTPADGTGDGGVILVPDIIGGQVVGVNVLNPGVGFTEIPEITINSNTGFGADLNGILRFTNIEELSQPLDPAKVVTVINCVSR